MTAPPGLPPTPTVRTDTRDTVLAAADVQTVLSNGAVSTLAATKHKCRCFRNRHGLAGPLLQRPR